jgi:hypothetical protein
MTALEVVPPDEEAATHSWQPANLIQLAENPPAPPTIGGLLYPGKRTVLSGETESMKTWLALILCKAELDIGIPVAWVDLDAMGPGALLERLQLLGVTNDQINDFLYYEPSQMLNDERTKDVTDTITARGIRLFVIDAFNPMLFLHGLDGDKNKDIEAFWTRIADPICRAGAAPVMIDHVVKNAEARGKYSTGSERKASGAIVHIGFKLLETLAQGGKGRALLNVHKDRPGYLQRPAIGRLVLTSTNDGIHYEIEPDKSHEGDTFTPTVLMEKVSRQLEHETGPLSKKQIEDIKLGKSEYVRKALDALVTDGYLSRQDGPRGAHLYTSIRPFREADIPQTATSSPPRPHLVPNLRSVPSSDLVPTTPFRGSGRGQRDRPETTSSQPRPRPEGQPIPEYDFPPLATDEPWFPETEGD